MERTQMEQRIRKLVGEGLYDKILVINCRVIPVTVYMMNLCNFTGKDLDQLDKGIKKILSDNNMHDKPCRDERLYLRRELGGGGTKGLKEVYAETKVRVTYYMTFSSSVWINEKLILKGCQLKRKEKKH